MSTAQKTKESEVSHVCKRCGFDNTHEPKVDPELLQDYYKKLLIQQPFEKEYQLLNSTVSVICTEPTRKLLSRYIQSWDILEDKSVQYAADLLCMLLISKITIKSENGLVVKYESSAQDKDIFFQSFTADTIENCLPDTYQNLPQIIVLGIKHAAQQFNDLCLQLAEAAQDENFWKGVGHV